jgi:hypothetical protein
MKKLWVFGLPMVFLSVGFILSGCAPDQVIISNDHVVPTVSIVSPTNGQEVASVYSISGTASDDDSGVAKVFVKLDNGAFLPVGSPFSNWTTNICLTTQGTHTNYVYAEDAAGNTSITQTVIVSCTSPVLTITAPSGDVFISGRSSYSIGGNFSVEGELQGIYISTNSSAFYSNSINVLDTNWSATINLAQGVCKTNVVKIFAKDEIGRCSATNQVMIVSYNKLVASDGTMSDCFGKSVSMSSNGWIIAMGAPGDVSGSGSLYIKQWDGIRWIETKIANYSAWQEFGCSVSVSLDGSTIAVGKQKFGYPGYSELGSALVYKWNGSTWGGIGLTGEQQSGDNFGNSIAVSSDGFTVVVGALNDDIGSNTNQGSVYIFRWNGTNWYDYQIITASDGVADDQFGYSVSISGDGNTVAVGAPNNDIGSNIDQGSVYIYTWNGTNIIDNDGVVGDLFGISVSLNTSGGVIAIGSENGNSGKGATYIYTKNDFWNFPTKIIASDGIIGDRFGCSVSINSTGKAVAIGAKNDDSGKGSVYIYKLKFNWVAGKVYAFDGVSGDYFGESVVISSDGSFTVVGAGYEDGASLNTGSAYMFKN